MENFIRYPEKHNEAEVEAMLWYSLRAKKIDARLQVPGYNEARKGHVRLDIVVFKDKAAKIIIECKSWSSGYARTAAYRTNNTKQLKKYRTLYHLPVIVCGRIADISYTVKVVEAHLHVTV